MWIKRIYIFSSLDIYLSFFLIKIFQEFHIKKISVINMNSNINTFQMYNFLNYFSSNSTVKLNLKNFISGINFVKDEKNEFSFFKSIPINLFLYLNF